MRVLMVTEVYPPDCYGGGWSTYNLAKALDESDDVEVKVLAVNQEEVKEDLPVEKVNVPRVPNERAYRYIVKETRKMKEDFDVVQGQHSLTIPSLAFLEDVGTVGVVRDYWPVCYKTTLRDMWGNNHQKCGLKCLATVTRDFKAGVPYKLWNHHYRKKLAKKIDVMAARSEFVEERLEDHGFGNTEVHYNFVEEGFSDKVEPEGEGDVLYVGQMTEQKGPQLLVEAIPEITEKFPDKRFVFLGEGEIKEELERKVEKLGLEENVVFRGHVSKEEVKSRMKGASVMVSPSLWYEPLSRVIIEAKSLGTPVITTDRGGNSESVEEEMVFDPEKESLADKVTEFLEGSFEQYMDHPSKKEVVEGWVETYQCLKEKYSQG